MHLLLIVQLLSSKTSTRVTMTCSATADGWIEGTVGGHSASIQLNRDGHWYTGIQVHWDTGIQEYRDKLIDTGIQVYRYTGIQVYRYTGIN